LPGSTSRWPLRQVSGSFGEEGAMSLGSHANVYNTCLRILRNCGFALRVEGEMTAEGCYPPNALWIAVKDGFHFAADNPIELLGLVAVYDYVRPKDDRAYWWRVEGPDLWTELMEAAFPDDDGGAEQGGAAE
jgi:hypothetical protein